MSNPTSNFGWQMPTPTDLVTDLPADFEVFGQAVDTSLADLKGGTTGQILSKATSTDMDFVWITNDQGDITAVNVTSPITGGGTSGAVTVGIQSASTSQSGAVQLSDSTSTTSSVLAATPTAVKSAYDLAASAYAPAFTNNFYAGKNKIINGDFSVNQYGLNSTGINYPDNCAIDRWVGAASGATGVISLQAFTAGTAPVTGYESTSFVRMNTTVGNDFCRLSQRIESVRTFANQTVTLSFWAKGTNPTTAGKLNVRLQQQFGTGGSAAVATAEQDLTLTASWTRYSYTFSVPSISGKTIATGSYLAVDIGQLTNASTQSWTLDVWGVQLEAGSTATPFQTATGTIQGELAACQRYYYRASASATYTMLSTYSNALTTAIVDCIIPLPVQMRNLGGTIDNANIAVTDGTTYYSSGTWTVSASTYGNNYPSVRYTHGSAALTLYRGYAISANNNASAYIGLSAEL